MSEQRTFSGDEISTMGLDDWRSMHEALQARFRTGDLATGAAMVAAVVEVAHELGHDPELDLRPTHLNVRLITREVFAKTERDVEMARRISAIAADLGVASEPARLSRVEIGLDTWDAEEIAPFWMAVLGVERHPRFPTDLKDLDGDLPVLWFQPCEPHDEPAQRFHLDIRVPPEEAETRIAAAVAAGGVVVSTERAPRFTVLADPQGNKVCVCTQIGRRD